MPLLYTAFHFLISLAGMENYFPLLPVLLVRKIVPSFTWRVNPNHFLFIFPFVLLFQPK